MGNAHDPYPGESHVKALVRALLYKRLIELWNAATYPEGWAITLAGPDACEVGPLKSYLRWPEDRVLFVDTQRKGLDRVGKEWPGAGVFRGKLATALDKYEGQFAFVNLDFMGQCTEEVQATIAKLKHRLAVGAVVSYTFSRGREHSGTKSWRIVVNAAEEFMRRHGRAIPDTFESIRWVGIAALTQKLLDSENIHLVGRFRYRSNIKDMGVMMLQYLPPEAVTEEWRALELLDLQTRSDESAYEMLCHHVRADMRKMSTRQLVALYHMPTTTIAAFKAAGTKAGY
jgi:hypothetical protein